MAGGTGGHVIPALAIAQKLTDDGYRVAWLGTRQGIESRMVPAAGIRLNTISVEGIRGKGRFAFLKAPFMLIKAVLQALKVLQKEKPSLVIGLGGFASGPGGLVAWITRVPLVIHEQNAVAGTTNRILAKISNLVLSGFPDVLGGEFVGNPVPANISALKKKRTITNKSPIVAILGGSLGAMALNQTVPKALSRLPNNFALKVIHQAGRGKVESTLTYYNEANVNADVVEFIDDMASVYEKADIIICRAGALTVSEVACSGNAAIFVPYPHAIDDHQTANAQWLVNNGAGILIRQENLTANLLASEIECMLSDTEKLVVMRDKAYELAVRDASDRVVKLLKERNYV